MNFIVDLFGFLSDLGKYIMVPLMVAIIGIGFRADVNKAIKGGITVGIGLFGLDLALSLVSTYLAPVATALVEMANLNLDVIDVGWTALSGIAYATEVGAFIIPFMLLVNIILLALGATKTMDIDIWNFWHYALTGSLIAVTTGNILYGFLAAVVHAVVIFAWGDRYAEQTQEVIGIPGVSIPHGGTFAANVIGWGMEKVYNRFGKKEEKGSADAAAAKKLSENKFVTIIKDPIYVGFILGVFVAALGGFPFKTIITTGMAMSAMLYLTPRMVKILMEGLVPISNACKKIMSKKYAGEQLYIGMDNAIILGHPTVMMGTVLMIPVCIILAMIVPGNRIIPMASLAACGYNCTILNVHHKGKPMRVFISCTILLAACLIFGSVMAETVTDVAVSTGFTWSQEGFIYISAISGTLGATIWLWLLFGLSPIVGAIASVVIILATVMIQRNYFKKKRELATVEFVGADQDAYLKK